MKQKRYRMNDPEGDSPWKLLIIFALICVGVSVWLSVSGDGWSPGDLWSDLRSKLDDPEVVTKLEELDGQQEAQLVEDRREYEAQVSGLRGQIGDLKSANQELRAQLERRESSP